MKNIHILPTNKPSMLFDFMTKLMMIDKIVADEGNMNRHIYITSDEEIKEGDWMYYKHFGEDIVCKYDTMNGQNTNVNEHKPFYQKIILTTDQELINAGVQPINDDFLEWFVKNPSCKFVEVTKEPLIIKGEADYFNYDNGTKLNTNVGKYKIIIPKEEPKQETIEKSAENKFGKVNPTLGKSDYRMGYESGLIEGAKWQAERMYSEEDMRLAIKKARDISDGKDCFDAEDISGCTEVCTYGWEFNMSEDLIIEQLQNKIQGGNK
jgi:hypothetical protein